jgi:ATP phosphoribosyltransferase
MKNIKVALTKGRIEKQALELFESIGVDTSKLKEKGRKLIFRCENDEYNIDFFLAKANDVITYVDHGVADMGVVGKDTILEMNRDIYEVLDLKKGICKFSVASLEGKYNPDSYKRLTIATKYPKVAKDYFMSKGKDVEIIKIEGSVELAPILNLADAIVDIVETGKTLKENGLVVYEDIVDISARLIVNKSSIKMKKDEINKIIENIDKVVNKEKEE